VSAGTLFAAPPRLERPDSGATLDDLLVTLWQGIDAHRAMECPVCAGEMRPSYGAHARAIGGKCADCGSTVQ
jgi:hypothetical protein